MSKFEKDLIQTMKEALAMAKGAPIGTYHHFPDPRDVRAQVKLTQAEMALLMGMSLSGYRKWEQGKRTPRGAANTLLRIMSKEPEAVLRALENA
jgi:putative transcriptional regulator